MINVDRMMMRIYYNDYEGGVMSEIRKLLIIPRYLINAQRQVYRESDAEHRGGGSRAGIRRGARMD